MQALTSAILGAFVLYAASWYFGFVDGNFALLLFLASLVTGIYWLAERFYFLPRRKAAVATLEANDAQRRAELAKLGIAQVDGEITEAKVRLLMQPWWLDWTAGLFPVIITVFLLRSFMFEPFKIPSGSMIPTLLVGDLILVNKFTYGLRLPVLNKKITEGNKPQRGDVMVFRYPPKPSLDYIKRVVGVPGDTVAYLNKRLTINGEVQPTSTVPEFFDEDSMRYFKQYEEVLGGTKHRLLNDDSRPAFVPGADKFVGHEGCSYTIEGVTCKVPPGQYFMMGDNRDNSMDSRYWGFVPDENIVGKAIFVWMNFSNPKRIGFFN
jgi:signal peptidase I